MKKASVLNIRNDILLDDLDDQNKCPYKKTQITALVGRIMQARALDATNRTKFELEEDEGHV